MNKNIWNGLGPALAVLFALACGSAQAINVDGNPTEWLAVAPGYVADVSPGYQSGDGTYSLLTVGRSVNLQQSNNAPFDKPTGSDIYGVAEDGPIPASGGAVDPGYGGQNFDIEALYLTYVNDGDQDQQGLYIGLFTGFDIDQDEQSGDWYTSGDLFFDFGARDDLDNERDRVWDLAIGLDPKNDADHFGAAYMGQGEWWSNITATPYIQSSPLEVTNWDEDGTILTSGRDSWVQGEYNTTPASSGQAQAESAGGEVKVVYRDGPEDHDFVEVFLSEAFLQGRVLPNATINDGTLDTLVHWTMSCGNDGGDAVLPEMPGVPEPMSMLMLGCLGAGMLGARKVTHRKKS